jgi:trans-2-enoyl-CoA reductase
MANWTRTQLETAFPDGSVSVQVDDDVRVMTTDEWNAWIDDQVGTPKIEVEALGEAP